MNVEDVMMQAKVMQREMQKLQERLKESKLIGMSDDEHVSIKMDGKGEAKDLSISLSTSREAAEQLIVQAFNNAKASADALLASETKKMMTQMGAVSLMRTRL